MSQYATILSTQPLITKAKKKEEKGAKKGVNRERENKPCSNTCNTSTKISNFLSLIHRNYEEFL